MPARQYRSTVEAKTLNQTITNSSTAIVLNSVTTLPTTYPYTLVLNPDTLTEEIVTVTSSGGGNTLNVTRGQDGTTAQAHNLGAAVRHMITARDLQEPQDHINNGGYHIIVCTSSTRPGSPVDGQHIYETNTDKTLSWDGTAWNPVSGAAAYQAGEPANPSVGSLWVDSDETASQLNTNDFLLKADASAASGYVSKVGGDTVVASGAAVKPLVLKGTSSQTANLQEWQNSSGTVVASVSPTGNITGGGLVHLNTTTISGQTSVAISNIFSSSFDNYRLVLDGTMASGGYVTMQLAGSTTAVYDYMGWETYRSGGTAASGTNTTGAASHFRIGNFYAQGGGCSVELYRPFTTSRTAYTSNSATTNADGSGSVFIWGGMHRTSASYTGMTLLADNAFTGTLRIYGYRN
jgi:hypothetical protein